jgi:hypothetical protein
VNQTLALVDLVAEHLPQITGLSPEDTLPDRLITETREHVGDALPRAPVFGTDRGYEDERFSHGLTRRVASNNGLSGSISNENVKMVARLASGSFSNRA